MNLFDLSNRDISQTGGFIEPASLIAFLVYLVVGGLVLRLVNSAGGGFGRWGSWRHA
jgi:hypothetical protein